VITQITSQLLSNKSEKQMWTWKACSLLRLQICVYDSVSTLETDFVL